MTTFSVTPGAAYRISVLQPQVAGTPTPSISYAWSLTGVPIGSGRVINYTFDGDGLPATLRCVITLSNTAGSVSRTLEATIQEAATLPVLNAVTIRDNAAPATIITSVPIESGDGHIGRVLRAGGPTGADLNPTGLNFTSLAYQWRRSGSVVTGATAQTYTISEADENATIAVTVTASNSDGSASRSVSVLVGEVLEKLPYGDHIGYVSYYDTNAPFANLIYSTIGSVCGIGFNNAFLGRGVSGGNPAEDLRFRTSNWEGKPEICNADGWLTRSLTGTLTSSNHARVNVSIGWQRFAELLQVPIEYDEFPLQPAEQYTKYDGSIGYRWPYPVADSLNGRTFRYVMSTYWEGTGYVHWNFYRASNNTDTNQRLTPSVVTFAESPFADGRTGVQMSKVAKEFTVTFPPGSGEDFIGNIIEESDPNDPVRNMLLLVSNVREVINPADPSTDVMVYEGFDQNNYTPFALYPSAKKKFQRAAVLRTTQLGYAHSSREGYRDNTLAWEAVRDENGDIVNAEYFKASSTALESYPNYRSVVAAKKHPCGAEFGLAAISRPTHAAFGHSLRAMIEICNQCDCDLWWTHPMWSMYVGRQTENGVVYPNRAVDPPDPNDPEQTGYLTVDPDYADWFVSELQHLKPGLKVYSEFVNELWNTLSKFWLPNLFSYSWALKGLADPQHGGDGQPLWLKNASRVIGASGRFAGTEIKKVQNKFGPGISILGACHLAKAFRDRNCPREIVAVAGCKGETINDNIGALTDAFALQPYLLKHLDALSIAPYRGPHNLVKPPEYPNNTQRAIIFKDVYGGIDEAWSSQVDVHGAHKPITDETSFWRRNGYLPFLTAWKRLALDLDNSGATAYSFSRSLPSGWQPSRRRWNLKLMAYECGTETQFVVGPAHGMPVETKFWAWERTHRFHFDPRHRVYARRYWEWLFSPGPKGLTDEPVTADDQALYRSGLRPAGLSPDQEPMCSPSVHLLTTQRLASGNDTPMVVWSNQISTLHETAPPQQGYEEAKARGVGRPNWWLNYDYGV